MYLLTETLLHLKTDAKFQADGKFHADGMAKQKSERTGCFELAKGFC